MRSAQRPTGFVRSLARGPTRSYTVGLSTPQPMLYRRTPSIVSRLPIRSAQRSSFFTSSSRLQSNAPQPRKGIRVFRFLFSSVGILGIAALAFISGATYKDRDLLIHMRKIYNAPIPTNEDTLIGYVPPDDNAREIDNHIVNHPFVQQLRNDPRFTESRPHLKIPEDTRVTNLTGGTLVGPGKIAVPPLVFAEPDGRSMISIFHLGEQLCGHPGIVHGGLLATLLDEGLARCCFPALPNKIAVTANLNVDYRAPARAPGYFVLKAQTATVEGRKAVVYGWIEQLDSNTPMPPTVVPALAESKNMLQSDAKGENVLGEGMKNFTSYLIGSNGEQLPVIVGQKQMAHSKSIGQPVKKDSRRLVEASGLFVEPAYAPMLKRIYGDRYS